MFGGAHSSDRTLHAHTLTPPGADTITLSPFCDTLPGAVALALPPPVDGGTTAASACSMFAMRDSVAPLCWSHICERHRHNAAANSKQRMSTEALLILLSHAQSHALCICMTLNVHASRQVLRRGHDLGGQRSVVC